jgi:hypothetical protein
MGKIERFGLIAPPHFKQEAPGSACLGGKAEPFQQPPAHSAATKPGRNCKQQQFFFAEAVA